MSLGTAALAELPARAQVSLPEAATTSAGIYDASGRLVRTLWSGRRHPAGLVTVEWDGRDDDGQPVASPAGLVARVLVHDVRYEWDGVIGNTSRDSTGPGVHRAFLPVHDMAIDREGNGFYVVGYNEQQPAIHGFDIADPQRRVSLVHDDYLRNFRYAATDGTLAYFANVGGGFEAESFVVALGVGDRREHRFTAGQRVAPPGRPGNRWESVVDRGKSKQDAPSGLAVQQRGRLLFVAHRDADEIRLFDKRSGEDLGRIELASPGEIAVAPDDSLWVLQRVEGSPALVRWREEQGRWRSVTTLRDGLEDPVAIDVSPVDGTIVVADAATEQLKAFDGEGRRQWTLGVAGGYRSGGPEVTHDRLWLSAGPTYVAFAADGSFWVGDPGNARNLHFSADQEYLGQIAYLPASYVVTADPGNPARVFRHFLEFRVDYSRPLRESWQLVRNWGAGLEPRYFGLFEGLQAVYTLASGRTYGVVQRPGTPVREIVELTPEGLRRTGTQLRAGQKLYADGSIRFHRLRSGSLAVYSQALEGTDENGDPRWSEPVRIAGVGRLQPGDPYHHDVPEVTPVNTPTFPITGGGLVVSFNPGRSQGFHLGAFRPDSDGWLWRASPSGSWELDAAGDIVSRDGRYELGRGVQYPGNVVLASGRHVIYGYHGEAWNGGQANQWMHFLEDGLFVGQFGRPVYPAQNRKGAAAEAAGNAFSPALVSEGGRLYLWHNDESVHGGIHRWRVVGADRIRLLQVEIVP